MHAPLPSTRPSALHAPLDRVVDLLLDAVCIVDADGRFLFVSAAFERIFGYAPDEVIGRRMLELVHPGDHERTLAAAREIMAGEHKTAFENRYVRKDGSIVDVAWSARWSEHDRTRIAVARDISERKRLEARQAALYAISEAAHASADLVALFRRIHEIVEGLLPARNLFVALREPRHAQGHGPAAGQDPDVGQPEALGFPYFVDERAASAPQSRARDDGALSAQVIRTGQALMLTPQSAGDAPGGAPVADDEAWYWLGVPLAAASGTIGALVVKSYAGGAQYSEADRELLQFVSTQIAAAIERKRLQARLQHIALYDPLTELPNRPLLHDRIGTALSRAQREQGVLALLYVDLDGFKQVNDALGHAAGDQVLKIAAQRMRCCLRGSDTVARIGGDEFVVLLERIAIDANAAAVAEKLRAALALPVEWQGGHARLHASIGVALYPQHGTTQKELLQRADEAMYRAKKAGGNRAEFAPSGSGDAAPG